MCSSDLKDAEKNPPKESGRYWCIVREITDLYTDYYQWNCIYNPEANWEGKWSNNEVRKDVVFWTEFAPRPF